MQPQPSRLASICALGLLSVCSPTHAAPLDVSSDRMELLQRTGEIRFEGNVVATQEDLTLRCARLLARYRKDGEVAELVAEGGVELRAEGLRATAARAHYRRDLGTLELVGDPKVERGHDQLTGARIIFWPDEGRMVVERARGRLGRVPRMARLKSSP